MRVTPLCRLTPPPATAALYLLLKSPPLLVPSHHPCLPSEQCSVTGLCEAGGYAALVYAIERSGKGSIFNAYVVFQVSTPLCQDLMRLLLARSFSTHASIRHLSMGPFPCAGFRSW